MTAEALGLRLGFRPSAHSHLPKALEHPSYAHEQDGSRGNERLEFLGDAVLDLAVSELLFAAHPNWSEGDLTRARAALVNTRALAERARELDLGEHVLLGKTELRDAGHDKDRILANVFEAVIGAVYLDLGFAATRNLCQEVLREELVVPDLEASRDAKTVLQEWAHAVHSETPQYVPMQDSGVEDSSVRFSVAVELGGKRLAEGQGRSKRAAERAAASAALARRGGSR